MPSYGDKAFRSYAHSRTASRRCSGVLAGFMSVASAAAALWRLRPITGFAFRNASVRFVMV